MTAGLPGTGIGGLFYLVSALLMPFVTLVRALRGRPVAPGEAFRQAGVAVGILVAMWITGALLTYIRIDDAGAARLAQAMQDLFVYPALLALTVLGTVVVAVETVAWVARLRQRLDGDGAGPSGPLPLPWPGNADGEAAG
jgi:hypothetical protein